MSTYVDLLFLGFGVFYDPSTCSNNAMKTEKQWSDEVQQSFREWKHRDPEAYYTFIRWNHYHRGKYYQELKLMEGLVERDGDLFVEVSDDNGEKSHLVPLV